MTDRRGPVPRQVFISHTLELLRLPVDGSFVEAAESAVSAVGDEVLRLDLSYAAAESPADKIQAAVQSADVHVLIAGFVYGAEVPGVRASYPLWEFDKAGEAGLPRLVFMLADDTKGPPELFGESAFSAQQAEFRQRLRDNGWITATVSSPDELASALEFSLLQLPRTNQRGRRGDVKSRVRPVRAVVAGVSSDRESREDALEITWDVNHIAMMLASPAVEAPLSVALLGDWGTGKSTFMLHLRNRVDELAARSAGRPEPGEFVTHVRQVAFNAWHYSDDHLWVGLVEHMFRELATTTPVSAERVDELEAALTQERTEQARLADQLAALEIPRGWLGWVHMPMRGMRMAVTTSGEMWREVGRKRIWIALVLAATGLAAAVYGQATVALLGGAITVVAPMIAAWTWLADRIEQVRQKLRLLKDAADEEVRRTEDELDQLDPKRRLGRLLDEISSADRYGNYRGLVGRIHHDLRRLSDDLVAATRSEPRLQRIVLYIDDLDRCRPPRVFDVLQAVNLLLTMDLFIVVVAVDPRWLVESLNASHGATFSKSVGPLDYLDKIFHIPFALRPMGDHAATYMRRLLPAKKPTLPEPPAPPRPTTERNSPLMFSGPSWSIRSAESLSAEVMSVCPEEQDFLSQLTALLRTPRAVKKLANLYRLVRLSVPDSRFDEFLGDDRTGGPYQATALLLAALVAEPSDARMLLESVVNAAPAQDICDVLTTPGMPTRLAAFITTLRKSAPVHGDVADYQRCAAMVARYGFETYDLFVATRDVGRRL